MTNLEITAILLLRPCSFVPGSFEKRFVRDLYIRFGIDRSGPLTLRQRAWLFRLVYRFRAQIMNRREAEARPFSIRAWRRNRRRALGM